MFRNNKYTPWKWPGNTGVHVQGLHCPKHTCLVFLYPIQVISSPVHSSNIRTRRHLVALFHFKCSRAYFKILGPRIDRSHVKDGRICHKISSNMWATKTGHVQDVHCLWHPEFNILSILICVQGLYWTRHT